MRNVGTAILAALFAGGILSGTAGADAANAHACVNRAGKTHGTCKHRRYVTVSGTVLAINGDLAQFHLDTGRTITVDQRGLIAAGQPLSLGGHFALRGYYADNIFIAQPGGADDASGNGYPYPGSTASVQGIITSISGNRVIVMQGLFSSITIDDAQAQNNGTAQNLYVGRSITAYGYWSGGTFYATSIG